MLAKILNRNLLKYSAGQSITCKSCGNIADYRRWVIWESPSGQHGASCSDCWQNGLGLVHDEKPHAYLLSIGWKVNTLVNFEKPARKLKIDQCPQKPGKALNTWLRKTIDKGHKLDRTQRLKTVFPAIIHRVTDKTYTNENGEWSNPDLTSEYVAAYCRLNHLTVTA